MKNLTFNFNSMTLPWVSRGSSVGRLTHFTRFAAMLLMLITMSVGHVWGSVVYCVTSKSSVAIHYWGNNGKGSNWDSKPMLTQAVNSFVVGSKTYYVYSYDVNSCNKVLFIPQGESQTPDLTVQDGQYYCCESIEPFVAKGWYSNLNEIQNGITQILNGSKIMFYGGEAWGDSNFDLRYSDNVEYSGQMTAVTNYGIPSNGTRYKFAVLMGVAGRSYQMGHWPSGMSTTVAAGGVYIIGGQNNDGSLTQMAKSGTNYLYQYRASDLINATKATTSLGSSSITEGSTLSVSTTNAANQSLLYKSQSVQYYLRSGSDANYSYEEISLSDGVYDASGLEVGSYAIITVLYDGNIYVKADEDDFTVERPQWKLYKAGGELMGTFTESAGIYTLDNITMSASNAYYYEYGSTHYVTGGENITTAFGGLTAAAGQQSWSMNGGTDGEYSFTIKKIGGVWKVKAEKAIYNGDLYIVGSNVPNKWSVAEGEIVKFTNDHSGNYVIDDIYLDVAVGDGIKLPTTRAMQPKWMSKGGNQVITTTNTYDLEYTDGSTHDYKFLCYVPGHYKLVARFTSKSEGTIQALPVIPANLAVVGPITGEDDSWNVGRQRNMSDPVVNGNLKTFTWEKNLAVGNYAFALCSQSKADDFYLHANQAEPSGTPGYCLLSDQDRELPVDNTSARHNFQLQVLQDGTYKITVTYNTTNNTVTVNAAPVLYAIAYGAADGCTSMGSVTAKVGASYETGTAVVNNQVMKGSTVWFKADANTGYHFVDWCDKNGSNLKDWNSWNPKSFENVAYPIEMYAKFEADAPQPSSECTGTSSDRGDGGVAFGSNGYSWKFTSSGSGSGCSVTVAWTLPDEYVGLAPAAMYSWKRDENGTNFSEVGGQWNAGTKTMTHTYSLLQEGTTYQFAAKFAISGGSLITKYVTYTVGDCQPQSFTLTWNLDGGTAGTGTITPEGSVEEGTVLQYTVAPTKTGYDFNGWSPTMTSGTTVMPSDNTTYVAQWSAKRSTVRFDFQGGRDGQSSTTATYGQNMPTDGWKAPVKDGSTFLGYFDDAVGGKKYYNADGSSAATWDKEEADVTLYAHWKPEVCVYVLKTLADHYEVPGVNFAITTPYLWAWDGNDSSKKFNTNMTVYPGPTASATYIDAMGNTWYKFVKNNDACGDYRVVLCAKNSGNDVKIFDGENKDNTVDGVAIGKDYKFSANQSIYIVPTGKTANTAPAYTSNPVARKPIHAYIEGRFRVRASEGGAWKYVKNSSGDWQIDSKNIEMEYDEEHSIYTLNTYATVAELSTKFHSSEESYFRVALVEGSNGSFVHYGLNESNGHLNKDSKSVTLLEDQTNRNVRFDDTEDPSGPVILTFNPETGELRYDAIANYTVTFGAGTDMTEMGSVSADNSMESGDVVIAGSNVTLTATENVNYKFVGWFATAACTGDALSTNTTYALNDIQENKAVYAKFEARQFAIGTNWGLDGHEVGGWYLRNMNLSEGTWSTTVTLNAAGDYTFCLSADEANNWSKVPNGNFGEITNVTKIGDVDFRFHLERKSDVTITFTPSVDNSHGTMTVVITPYYNISYNANGHGVDPEAVSVLNGTRATEPTKPVAAGWYFGGWYQEAECTNRWDFNTAVSQDMNLYAKWRKCGWFVHYEGDDNKWHKAEFVDNTVNVTVNEAKNYQMDILNVHEQNGDVYYKNANYMVWDNCTGWVYTTSVAKVNGFKTTKAGTYTFTLAFENGNPKISLTYPDNEVTYNDAEHGSVSGSTSVRPNAQYTITATPNAGYYLSAIACNEANKLSSFVRQSDGSYLCENYRMGAADETWTATFAACQMSSVSITESAPYAVNSTLHFTPNFPDGQSPKGTVTLCYKLYKKNSDEFVEVDDAVFTPNEATASCTLAGVGIYKVGVTMHSGSECAGAQIGDEAFTDEFEVNNLYTVTYAVVGENGTLAGAINSTPIAASPASVTGGSDVVFTATPATGYSVEGWYSDEDCANSIGTRGETSLTIENIAADASVYVRFWAPASVSGIAVANAAGDNLVNGETITATPTVASAGKGNKAYCWTLTKGGNTVATEFTWADNKAVSFSVKEAGDYTLTLTVHSEGTCSGLVDGSFAKNFTVYEDEWYIIGDNGFWAYSNRGSLTPQNCSNGEGIKLLFNKDKYGNFYWGPFQFKWLGNDKNYQYFRLYNRGKGKQYVAQTSGNFTINTNYYDEEHGITLKWDDNNCFTFDENLRNTNYYLYIKDGKMWASTVGPQLETRVRLRVTKDANPTYYSNEVVLPEDGTASEPLSFYAAQDASVVLEKFILGTGWVTAPNVSKLSFTSPAVTESGVYVTTLTRSVTPSVGDVYSVDNSGMNLYDGTYYIRTNAAAGGWNDYMTYADNVMHKSDFLLNKNGFDYFYVNWVLKDQKINYQIANKYNPAISEEFRNDAITNTTTLPADANIRYMWNSQTNTFDRAYISGSSKISDRFLVLEGDEKLFDKDGNALNISGLSANELNFADNGNWIYQADAKAQPGARAKLTAKYNGTTQYFWGKVGERTDETTEQIFGGTGENLYRIRLMYDFKTNRLLSAWLADDSNNPVTEELTINADVMIVRKHQESAQQITFENSGKLLDVKTVYGVMQFDKYTLNNRDNDGNILPVENRKSSYERYLYWVSFPFDVKLNEVFGFGNYGEHWVLQYYDGAARATNGFWADVDTYWKTVSVEESRDFVMQKNTGYVISLTPIKVYYTSDIFNHTSEVALYFPSAESVETIDGELPTAGDFVVPGYQCTITRDERNIKDSHWNVIGVPGYADVLAQNVPDQQSFVWEGVHMEDIKFIYEWNKTDNSLVPFENTKDFTFQTMHSYMAQYAGGINWQGGVVPTALAAARRAQADDENKTIKLVLKQGDKDVDRTFVAMDEEATNSFDMNMDMCKVFKSDANIYTMIDYSIEVAGNVMPTPTTQMFILVGVKIAADGEYTFAMPEGTNGEAVYLIDYDTNVTTNLSIMDYTVMLTAGTINDRFALKFVPKSSVVTGVDNTDSDGNRTVKYLEDCQLRILRDGRIFDAQGRIMK